MDSAAKQPSISEWGDTARKTKCLPLEHRQGSQLPPWGEMARPSCSEYISLRMPSGTQIAQLLSATKAQRPTVKRDSQRSCMQMITVLYS